MKYKRVNEDQIDFIITTAELEERKIFFKGTKEEEAALDFLYEEILKKAVQEFGFSKTVAVPLLLDVIPVTEEQKIIVRVKVDREKMTEIETALGNDMFIEEPEEGILHNLERQQEVIFSFDNFETLLGGIKAISPYFRGEETLYKNPNSTLYYLIITKTFNTVEEFFSICGLLLDHGKFIINITPEYYKEHYIKVLENSISALADL